MDDRTAEDIWAEECYICGARMDRAGHRYCSRPHKETYDD